MDPVEIERSVGLLDGLLREPGFMQMMDEFCNMHCGTFENTEENKFEYTTIFKEFQVMVDQHLEARLVAEGVDLASFLAALPDYMNLEGAHQQTGAIFDLLLAFTDFPAFKDFMLQRKKTLINANSDPAASVADRMQALPDALQANLELMKILEDGGNEDGWECMADKGWIQTYRKPDPESPIHMSRCFAKVNMPSEALIAIFMDPCKKTTWDKEVLSCEVIGGGGYAADGYVVRQIVKIPLCTPRELLWRWQVVQDFPEPGCITGVIYDEPCADPPLDGALRVVCKIGNLIVRPDGPESCRLSMFGHMDFHFPAFIWNYTSSNWLQRNVTKLETAYSTIYQGQSLTLDALVAGA
jgi:hypothetical protein